MTNAISISRLSHAFGPIRTVDDVTLDVRQGALFGLLGPDGAGKSTLFRMLATLLRPDSGDAQVLGSSVSRSPGQVTPRIGYMSQQFCMYPDLSVMENIEFFATLRGVPRAQRRERAASLLASMGMDQFTRRQAGRLSGGMKQKLMLASVLMHAPDVLLLDEPTTGVDPVSRREFWRILGDLHDAGRTVLVATPYMDEAEHCTDIAFMSDGRITTTGTPDELKTRLPGTLLEIVCDRPRDVLVALETRADVASAHLLGDAVRCLWVGDDPVGTATRLLAPLGGQAHAVPADMEAVFAYLAVDEPQVAA